MDKEIASRAFVDFFALRPVFTAWGLKAVWVIFLIGEAYALFGWLYGMANSGVFPTFDYWISVIEVLLPIIIDILLVRILLDVAAKILIRQPTGGD